MLRAPRASSYSVIQKLITRLCSERLVRFLFFGGSAAVVNLLLMELLVQYLNWNTALLRNAANVVSVELSLLYSFLVYRLFVWRDVADSFQRTWFQQLTRYHFSAGTSVLIRWCLLFPVLDGVGVDYRINTILGAALSCMINYALSNRFVFNAHPEVESQELGSEAG